VILDGALQRMRVRALMIDTLPISIMPALYFALMKAGGDARMFYGPYLPLMVNFIKDMIKLDVFVSI